MARVAVVTGGTRGIGHAISVALKKKGYRVAATYAGNDAAAQVFQGETGIPVYKWNVGDYAECDRGLKQVERDLGPVDVVVNNAGITRDGVLHRMTPEQWGEVIAVNLNSMFNMTRPVIDGMRARNFGRIINMASIYGQRATVNRVDYVTTKTALIGLTRAVALEAASQDITCNAICPGTSPSPNIEERLAATMEEQGLSRERAVERFMASRQPSRRFVAMDSVAALAAFLCGPGGADLTGAVIPIDGGWSAS